MAIGHIKAAAARRLRGIRTRSAGLTQRLRPTRSEGAGAGDDLASFRRRFEAAVSSGERGQIDTLIQQYRETVAAVEAAVAPDTARSRGRPIELVSGAQSKQFMMDLLPTIQDALARYPRGEVLDVLDVGPGTGHGSNLLASLYASAELGYRLRVVAFDITDAYSDYIGVACRWVRFIKRDIFEAERRFDFVIASHVIEHLEDPLPFCRRLQELARDRVFIVAPYEEPEEGRTQGHVWSVDEAFVEALAPISWRVVNSRAWGAFMSPPYKMLIAELEGSALASQDDR